MLGQLGPVIALQALPPASASISAPACCAMHSISAPAASMDLHLLANARHAAAQTRASYTGVGGGS